MKRALLIIALVAAALMACTKQSLKTTYDKQATYIDGFVSAQMSADPSATLVRNGGSYRITLKDAKDPGDSLLDGGTVTLEYACYILTSSSVSSSNLVETNKKEVAEAANWTVTDESIFTPRTMKLDGKLIEGLRLGLHGVQPGDEGYILFTGEFGYGNRENGTIPAKSALAYHIWIESISNE